MKKIVICGGHLTPAIALIEELKTKDNISLLFFGRKYATEGSRSLSAEYQTIKNLGIEFYPITAGRLQRKFTIYTIWAILKIPVGFIQSLYYLIKVRPNLIVAFGGYLSLPIVFAGWLLGVKSITHDQSIEPGLANKLNSLFVEKIFLTWPASLKFFAKNKSQVIGNLSRKAIFNKNTKDKKLEAFLKNSQKLILAMGGNQGAHFLNRMILELLPKLSTYQIIHQVGTTNYKGDLDNAKEINQKNYLAIDYIGADDIGAVLSRADLVISRSGANTVWDLAILAKVAILVPLPIAAGNEQAKNAKILENAKSAIILNQKDLNAEILKQKIDYMFKNLPKFQKAADSFSKTLPKNASTTLTSEILKLVGD